MKKIVITKVFLILFSIFLISVQTIYSFGQTFPSFPAASPVFTANILYNSYTENSPTGPRGHITATRIYDPTDPDRTEKVLLWDAGVILNNMNPNTRNICFPAIDVFPVIDITIATGDGNTTTFSGTLFHPILSTTIRITDQQEIFSDSHTGTLTGSLGGSGTINHFTGDFQITFNTPPASSAAVKCSYTHYGVHSNLKKFTPINTDNLALALDLVLTNTNGYVHDLDGNGTVNELDGDYLARWTIGNMTLQTSSKQCLLGPVTYGTPALATPPGRPHWYYGTDITKKEQNELDTFITANKTRRTLLYVAAGSGMVHAFDAGQFQWGDNPETMPIEQRGYFNWDDILINTSLATQWNNLLTQYPIPPPQFKWQSTGKGDKAPDYGTGEEQWAFISPAQLPLLKDIFLGSANPVDMDSSPVIGDVYFNGQWHTVLVCTTGRKSGKIFCLDITVPDNPIFLWEYSDPHHVSLSGKPMLPQIGLTAISGIKRWVLFLTSNEGLYPKKYPSISFIAISNGNLIHKQLFQTGMDRNNDGLDDAQGDIPCGQATILDSDGNGYVDRLYLATEKGFVFKLNIPDDPAISQSIMNHCLVNTTFSYMDQKGFLQSIPLNDQYHPISGPPTIMVQNSHDINGNLVPHIKIIFGTNAVPPSGSSIPATNYLFCYSDHSSKGVCDQTAISLDWFRVLDADHCLLVSAFVSANTIFFGTNATGTLPSNPNTNPGHFYALGPQNGAIKFDQATDKMLSPPVVIDEHVFMTMDVSNGKDPLILGSGRYNNNTMKNPNALSGIQAWKELW